MDSYSPRKQTKYRPYILVVLVIFTTSGLGACVLRGKTETRSRLNNGGGRTCRLGKLIILIANDSSLQKYLFDLPGQVKEAASGAA